MHAFADDVRQGVVADLRELCVAVIKVVGDRFVVAESKVKIDGPVRNVPEGTSGEVR